MNQIGQSFLEIARELNYGEFHFKRDEATGLEAIIAVHSTTRGPAVGGCRFVSYDTLESAFLDVLRLAKGMSYKAAIADLPLGGGKSVIIRPDNLIDRTALLKEFGSFVHSMNGRYITAEDSGTTVADMDIIKEVTPHVLGASTEGFAQDDPSPLTALGVCRGIEAAVKFKLGKDSVSGLTIAIQGVGNVGYPLAQRLHELGANLIVSDISDEALDRCVKEFSANVVSVDDIHKQVCDVYAPCALSDAINSKTVNEIRAGIVAGAANNQLSNEALGQTLFNKEILYAPDFVINAGGLIHVYAQLVNSSETDAKKKVENIYLSLLEIFKRSRKEKIATHIIANKIAEERLGINNYGEH